MKTALGAGSAPACGPLADVGEVNFNVCFEG